MSSFHCAYGLKGQLIQNTAKETEDDRTEKSYSIYLFTAKSMLVNKLTNPHKQFFQTTEWNKTTTPYNTKGKDKLCWMCSLQNWLCLGYSHAWLISIYSHSSINGNNLTGDVGSSRQTKKSHQGRNFMRFSNALNRRSR